MRLPDIKSGELRVKIWPGSYTQTLKPRGRLNSRPHLPLPGNWEDTLITVHLWSQVISKIRLELSPWINHSWGSALYVSSKGLSTSPIPYGGFKFEIDFNFIEHKLEISTSNGERGSLNLEPMSVADFYSETMKALQDVVRRM